MLLTVMLGCFGAAAAAVVADGTCGDNLTWVLDDAGVLTVSGTGPMTDYASASGSPWYKNRSSIITAVINNGVTSIGKNAFAACYNMTNITLPNGITGIGYGAFNSCVGLTGISIPNSVKSIGENAFNDCANLADFSIPDSVTDIGEYAFHNCGMTEITFPGNITSIGYATFGSCYNLTKVTIQKGVTVIGDSVFSQCENLVNITIPDSVVSIGSNAFCYCRSMKSISIPSSVTNIHDRAFSDCKPTICCEKGSYADSWATEHGMEVSYIDPDPVCVHSPAVTVPAVAPTCTEPGNTETTVCSKCGAVLTESEVIPATGHTVVEDKYIAPTRTTGGITSGSHCEVCGEILEGNEPIAPLKEAVVVTLPREIEGLDDEAYMGSGAVCVRIDSRCRYIAARAFARCALLTVIEIPAGVTDIAEDAFEGSPNVIIVTTEGSYAKLHQMNYMIIY